MQMQRRAFTIVDLVVAIGVAGVLSAAGVPAVRMATSDNALQRCRYNLRGLAQGSAMYSEDFGGRIWALSWRQGMTNPSDPRTKFGSDMHAQSFQAGYAMRRMLNLTPDQSPISDTWTPTIFYSHVALLDYMGATLPSQRVTCPLDAFRTPWLNGDYSNLPTTGGAVDLTLVWRWLAQMSYSASVYQWMPSRQVAFNSNGQTLLSPTASPQSTNIQNWNIDTVHTGWWGPRMSTDVRFPSQKVFMADEFARHNGAARYYAYPTAAQDLMFYDGSVRFYRTDSTNPGWHPGSAGFRSAMTWRFTFTRYADLTGGLDNNKASDTFAAGWYRWTRGGLLGWDVPRLSSMVGKPPSANVVENELNTSVGTW